MEDKTLYSPILSYSNQLPPMSSACKTYHHLEKRSIRKIIIDAPGLSQYAATNLYRVSTIYQLGSEATQSKGVT